MHLRVLIFLVMYVLTGLTASAAPIDPKTRGLLTFIGSIEGPAGYDDYYRGVSSAPPRPVSSMSIGQVLDWQDSIDAQSNSEAAGRYQIMEDTLRGLVRSEGIDKNTPFNAATQDRLAAILLKRRGWDPASTDYVKMGNAIAYEWAALPVCSGSKKGRSAYDGLAGNHSLTTCEAYLAVLASGDDPSVLAWAQDQSVIGTGGTGGRGRIDNFLEEFIRDYKNTFYNLADNLVVIATSLLFSLMLIEWIWTTAVHVGRGAGTGEYISALAFRIVVGGAFLFIINLGNYSDMVIRSADGLLGQTTSGATINVVSLYERVLEKTFELWGNSTFGIVEKFAAVLVLLLGAMIVGLIILSYMETYVAFGAAVLVLGFGGFSKTRHIAINYIKRAIGRILRLFTALICVALVSVLLTTEFEGEAADGITLVGIMINLLVVILRVPSAVEQAVVGSVSISAGETFADLIRGTPRKLAQLGGLPGAK